MRSTLLVAAAVLCLLMASQAVSAERSPAADLAKKGKKACKGTKVAVKLGKRTTCRPFAKLFPKPSGGDLRLSYLRQTLKYDAAKLVKGKNRKRVRTLQSGFGAAGKRAQKKILGLLPRALAFFDRKRAGASASALGPGAALASANCGVGAAGEKGTLGGSSTIRMLGGNGMFIETDAGGGLRIRVTFFSCGGVDSFRVPECPTADGDVVAPTATGDFSATTEIWRGDELQSRNSTRFEDSSKARGKVGKDAKLKYIEVEHKQEVLIIVPGHAFRGGVERKVKINMPAGNYDPTQATVKFTGPDSVGNDLGAQAFARTARAAIDSFKSAEEKWSSFERRPFCAKAVFAPANETLKLNKGQTGPLNVHATAQAGGTAKEARWTLIKQVNAGFAPGTSEAANPSFNYTVNGAPTGGFVEVTAKFTSTAGVGEDSWKQPLSGSLPSKFAATFSGTATYNETYIAGFDGDIQANWSGNADLREAPSPYPPGAFPYEFAQYALNSGSLNYSFSGVLGDCSYEGGGQIDLGEQPDLAGAALLVIFDKNPREYQFLVPMPLLETVPATKDCPPPEEDGEVKWSPAIGVPLVVNAPLPGGPVGDQWSISGTGSGDTGPGSPHQGWQWNLNPTFGP